MINLLPTEMKEQVKFARYNTQVIVYTLSIIAFVAALIAAIYYGLWVTNMKLVDIEEELKQSELRLSDLNDIETRSTKIRKDLTLVEQLYERESKLVDILLTIEDSIPFYSRISTLELNQSTAGPLELQFTVPNLIDAAALRNNLVLNEAIENVDIQSITPIEEEDTTRTNATLVITVKGYEPVTAAKTDDKTKKTEGTE